MVEASGVVQCLWQGGRDNLEAVRPCQVDVTPDLRELICGGNRPDLRLLVEGIAQPQLGEPRLQVLHELVMDALVDDQPGGSDTALAGCTPDPRDDRWDNLVEVGVVEHDEGGLATGFDHDVFE